MPAIAEPSVVNFGRIKNESATLHRTVSIFRGDGAALNPKIELGHLPNVDAQLCEIEPGEHYELEVSVSPPFEPGRLHDRIMIHTGIDEVELIGISVSAMTPQRLTLTPGQVAFPVSRPAEITRTVNLTWNGSPGNIVRATTTLPEATVTVGGNKKKPTVSILLGPGENDLKTKYQLALETDDPGTGTRMVPIRFINLNQGKNARLSNRSRSRGQKRGDHTSTVGGSASKAPGKKPKATGSSSGQR